MAVRLISSRLLSRALSANAACRRTYGTCASHALQPLLGSLHASQPAFALSSKDVRILSKPDEFYQKLLNMIRHAKRRIFISTLYIGVAETELLQTLQTALATNPSLTLTLVLDHNRSTRPELSSSTAHALLPLLEAYPDRVRVHMYRSPKLKGLMARIVPPRFNEGWGTWHAKIYGVDDDVIISGANLNSSYFTDRQDRYVHLASQPTLNAYLESFLRTISTFSYRLLPSQPTSSQPYTLHWPDADTHPHHIEDKAHTALTEFQSSFISQNTPQVPHLAEAAVDESDPDPSQDTLLFPMIQSGVLGIREEERCLSLLFDHVSGSGSGSGLGESLESDTRPVIDLTSGYFALYKPYQDRVLESAKRGKVDWRIVAASPQANGFLGSKGVSGRIPEGYRILEARFWKRVMEAGVAWKDEGDNNNGKGIQLSEWGREGWTYHAKGIWHRPTATSHPDLTLFGSTNLNSRAANLDSELSFLMYTRSPALQGRLGKEVDELLRKDVRQVGSELVSEKTRWSTRALVWAVESML
ncbi:hypothetical protein BOTBODRAFT_106477 [Botryobasidium botryosum FD-172 SS1]|uniref:CDP-diacylglycerol--glycerol-3-phosphate 3-phosphatidyltransferase n=1 Tax=Botryobasidium botryosum (strain FD-172 SS1) TaxID=930990 RepID=A0A067MM87_BOTB1|nr:hypothetical protein BOTBODRAFT_106477 [Botryobasidium botryosum FD-172 SS1]